MAWNIPVEGEPMQYCWAPVQMADQQAVGWCAQAAPSLPAMPPPAAGQAPWVRMEPAPPGVDPASVGAGTWFLTTVTPGMSPMPCGAPPDAAAWAWADPSWPQGFMPAPIPDGQQTAMPVQPCYNTGSVGGAESPMAWIVPAPGACGGPGPGATLASPTGAAAYQAAMSFTVEGHSNMLAAAQQAGVVVSDSPGAKGGAAHLLAASYAALGQPALVGGLLPGDAAAGMHIMAGSSVTETPEQVSAISTPQQSPRSRSAHGSTAAHSVSGGVTPPPVPHPRIHNMPLRPGPVHNEKAPVHAAPSIQDGGDAGSSFSGHEELDSRQQEMGAAEAQRLTQMLEEGGQARRDAVEELRGRVWPLSLDKTGCRVVQTALEDASRGSHLVEELVDHVQEAMESPHANYVIQQVVQVMPAPAIGFIAAELESVACKAARHRYGCRIVCRLLEHSAHEDGTARLVNAFLMEAAELSRHVFGHHVVQSTLEHGMPRQRHRVAEALRGDLPRNARNRNASYVLETALTHCSPEDRAALAAELREGGIAGLAQSQFGRHVVKSLLRLQGEESQAVLRDIRAAEAELRESKHGRRLLEELPRLGGCPAAMAAAAGGYDRPHTPVEGG